MDKRPDNFKSSYASLTGAVPRTDLIKKMQKAAKAKKSIYISAPGGYGKTIAAMQWLSVVSGKTTRMAVGEADNNPNIFYRRLASALLGFKGKRKAIPDIETSFNHLLDLIRAMPKKESRCFLVIDDLHIIKNEEIINSLPLVMTHLPGYVAFCLISRSEPDAAMAESGMVEVFTKEDLLFSEEEIEWLAAETEQELDVEQIRELRETTGGWAMHISALLAGGKTPVIKRKQTLIQYLDSRVWTMWDADTKSLLLRIAVPEEVTPELCELLTGEKSGREILNKLVKKENAFLSLTSADTYRFHDVFRDFLSDRTEAFLGGNETRRMNDIAAKYYYEREDYYSGVKHYVRNNDHEGIDRCIAATNRYNEKTAALSVETELNYTKQFFSGMEETIINENPRLLTRRAVGAYHDGEVGLFLSDIDKLNKRMPEIMAKYPDLIQTVMFATALDHRAPLIKLCEQLAAVMQPGPEPTDDEAGPHVNSITQNFPYFHRSMRDYSEYHLLSDCDMNSLRNTFGAMIGRDYRVIEPTIIAGILYERGELLEALHHALCAYRSCQIEMHPETIFSANMILSTVLYAMGANMDAENIMNQTDEFIKSKARFLHPNFKALQTEKAIRNGDTDAAREWLAGFSNRRGRLPFYQISRHHTTMRSFIALGDDTAAEFGGRLCELAVNYNRPLDQIEGSILLALALARQGKTRESHDRIIQSIKVAIPYNFTQLFAKEGKEILPLLWELHDKSDTDAEIIIFSNNLIKAICKSLNLETSTGTMLKLTAQHRAMLPYLDKSMSYNEIAESTGLSRTTIKSHLRLLYKRLNVHTAQEAVIKAKTLGIL